MVEHWNKHSFKSDWPYTVDVVNSFKMGINTLLPSKNGLTDKTCRGKGHYIQVKKLSRKHIQFMSHKYRHNKGIKVQLMIQGIPLMKQALYTSWKVSFHLLFSQNFINAAITTSMLNSSPAFQAVLTKCSSKRPSLDLLQAF